MTEEQMVVDVAGGADDAIPWVKEIKTQNIGISVASFIYHEASSSFIFFTNEGLPYQLTPNTNELIPFEGSVDTSKPYFARYAPARRSLVFQSGNRLLVRRDQSGTMLLNSAFSTNAACSSRAVCFELPLQEGLEWQQYFKTKGKPYLDLECPPITMIVSLFEKQLAAVGNKPMPKSFLIVLPEAQTSLNVLSIFAAKMKKENTSDYPLFPLMHWLIERVRWSLDPRRPYHTIAVDAGMPTPNATRAIEALKDPKMIDVNAMNSEAARVLTFKKWPHMMFKYALPYRMAETGFFFQPNTSGYDRVVCYSCSISLVMWDPNDEPLQEHERHHSNHCRFMEEVYSDNVPLDVTSAVLPSIFLPYTPQGKARVVSSTMNVSAEFYASCMCEPACNFVQLSVVHLDSAPLVAHKLRISLGIDFGKYFSDVLNPDYPVNRRKAFKITALAVAGKEREQKVDDADAECELYVGISVHPGLVGHKEEGWLPFVLVYNVSRHLERVDDDASDNDRSDAPSSSSSARPRSSFPFDNDYLCIQDPSFSLVDFEKEGLEMECWSSDDVLDEFELSTNPSEPTKLNYVGSKKVSRKARHEEPSPTVEVDYDPYILRHSFLRCIDLSRASSNNDIVPGSIEQLTVSDVNNGLVCAVLKPQKPEEPTRIVHFERDFEVAPLTIRSHEVTAIKKTVILPVDHFASARVIQMGMPGDFGTNVSVGSTVFLTETNELHLLDPVSNSTISIAENVTDFVVDEQQNIVYTDMSQNLKTAMISAPLAGVQAAQLDELALSMVGFVSEPKSASNIDDVAEAFKDHPSKDAIVELLKSLDVAKPITTETLKTLHSLIQTEMVHYGAHMSKSMTPRTAIAAVESFLQHSLGFQMTAPPHWVEIAQHVESRQTTNTTNSEPPAAAAAASGPGRSKESSSVKVDDAKPKPTRHWQFQPEKEQPLRSYVFEMAILPGMPLAHINFKFGFSSAKFGCPDAQFSIYRNRSTPKGRQSVSVSTDAVTLIPLCDTPALLESQCDRVLDPVALRNFLDPGSTSATIQISTAFILEVLAAKKESLEEGWFTKPIVLFLLIETSQRPSLLQQVNARSQMLANIVKTRNKSDKSTRSSKSTTNKKKHHYTRKAFTIKPPPASQFASGYSSAFNSGKQPAPRTYAKRKDAFRNKSVPEPQPSPSSSIDLAKLVPGTIDEFSITLFRTTSTEAHSQLQRLLLQKDPTIQKRLLDVALRKTPVGTTVDEIYGSQLRALDLLTWVSQNWRTHCSSPGTASTAVTSRIVIDLLSYIIEEYNAFFASAFGHASRSVSQRWSSFFGQVILILVNQDAHNVESLFSSIIDCFSNSLINDIPKLSKSSGLHWFLSTTFASVYSITHIAREGSQNKAIDGLAGRCIDVIRHVGLVFQSRWSESSHFALSSKYGHSALVFELDFYDFPTQLMGYRYLTDNVPIDYDTLSIPPRIRYNGPMSSSAPQPFVSSVSNMFNQLHGSHDFGQSHPHFGQKMASTQTHKSSSSVTNGDNGPDETTLISGKLFPLEAYDSMAVLEMLNVSFNDDWKSKRSNWASTCGSHDEWFDMLELKGPLDKNRAGSTNGNSYDVASRFSWKRFPIGSDIMPCLLEVEQLGFTVSTTSDHAKLFNPDTSLYVPFEPVSVFPNAVAPEVQQLLNVSVPTTSVIFEEDFEVGANFSRDLLFGFLPPPDYVLSFERVTTHSKRNVVLDFGGSTLITDFIIPPCEYVQSVFVEGIWSDAHERVRLGYSNSIGHKALIVSGLVPGVIVQKIQLTFVMRRPQNIKMRVPIGRFWGTKWLTGSEAQLAFSTANAPKNISALSNSSTFVATADNIALTSDARSSLTGVLEFFCEDVRSRYVVLLTELERMVNNESTQPNQIRNVYRDCIMLRFQWNSAYRILERLREASPGSAENSPVVLGYEALPTRSLSTLPLEQLKTVSEYLCKFISQLSNVVDLRDATREVTGQTLMNATAPNVEQLPPALRPSDDSSPRIGRLLSAPLTLNSAVDLFDYYCAKGVPSLQSMATAYIFKAGVFTEWWGDFFPLILQKYFNADDYNSMDTDVFPLLSVLCAHSTKHGHLQQVVMEKLFNFVISVSNDIFSVANNENPEDASEPPKFSPLLSWTLQLMSTAFDVVSSNKRKTDRWSFLNGSFTHPHSNGWSPPMPPTPPGASCVLDSVSTYLVDGTPLTQNAIIEKSYAMNSLHEKSNISNIALSNKFVELFGPSNDFFTELDKPCYIARRLDILQFRLAYLYTLIKVEQTPDRPLGHEGRDYRAVLENLKQLAESNGSTLPSSSKASPKPTTTSPTPPGAQSSEDLMRNRLMIVPLHNLQSRIRVRQYSARLKINENLCLSVVKSLMELLLSEKAAKVVPLNSQLVALKVISKVCLHGAMVPISLTAALGDYLPKLIFKLLENAHENDWMRHALLMLLIDLTDGEMRTLGRATPKSETDAGSITATNLSSIKEKIGDDQEDTDDLGVECKRHKLDVDVDASEVNSVSNDVVCDQDMEDVTSPETATPSVDVQVGTKSETAIACGAPDVSWIYEPETTEFITFANFDKPDPDNLDDYIIRAALATIIGAQVDVPHIFDAEKFGDEGEKARINVCLQYCYRMARAYIDRGDPTTLMWHFFDDALYCEEEYFKRSLTLSDYISSFRTEMNLISRAANAVTPITGRVSSTVGFFITFLDTYMTPERIAASRIKREDKEDIAKMNLPPDGFEFRWQQALMDAKYFTRLDAIRALAFTFKMTPSSFRTLHNHYLRFQYKLKELTELSLDVTGERTVSAKVAQLQLFDQRVVDGVFPANPKTLLDNEEGSLDKCLRIMSKVMFIHSNWPQYNDFLTVKPVVFSEHTLVELSAGMNELNSPSEPGLNTVADVVQPLDTAELKCALESLTTELHLGTRMRIFNIAVHFQFASEIGIAAAECFQVQPFDIAAETFTDSSLSYRAGLDMRFTERLRSSLSRNVLYNFVPHCPSPRRLTADEVQSSTGLGSSVHSIVAVVDQFLRDLSSTSVATKIREILAVYLEYVSYVDCAISAYTSNKSFSLDSRIFAPRPLSTVALTALMNYIVTANGVSEDLWQEALFVVNRCIHDSEQNLVNFVQAVDLDAIMVRFFADSRNAYGLATSFGSSSHDQFSKLLQRLMKRQSTNSIFFNKFVDLLNRILCDAENKPNGLGDFPIDSLFVALTAVSSNFMYLLTGDSCDGEKIALLLHRVLLVVKKTFPRTDAVLRICRLVSTNSSTSHLMYTNVCFSSFLQTFQEGPVVKKPPENTGVTNATLVIEKTELPKLPVTFVKSYSDGGISRRVKPMKNTAPFNVESTFDDYMESNIMTQFDGLRPFSSEPVLERCTRDRAEGLFVAIIRFIDQCSALGPVWKLVIQRYPESISNIIEMLGDCESAVESLTDIPLNLWRPTTLADHLLYALISVSNAADFEAGHIKLIELLIEGIFVNNPKRELFVNASPTACSHPLVWSLLIICKPMLRMFKFAQLGGQQHLSNFLERTIDLIAQHWPPKMTLFKLGTQQNNLANDINSITSTPFDVRVLPHKTINGLQVYNFGPQSRVHSNATMGQSGTLVSVLQDPVPQRRSKYVNYSYSFQPFETWFTFTVTLPVPAMLQEIQIRFHQTSESKISQYQGVAKPRSDSPSAVQIELSSDSLHWTLFGGQIGSAGLQNVGIDATIHKAPVGAIRFHMRRPQSQCVQISLHQILIYCTSTATANESAHNTALQQWLTVFDRLHVKRPPFFKDSLSQSMVLLYLRLAPDHPVYSLLRKIIFTVNTLSPEPTMIKLLVQHILNGGRLANGPPTVATAELLYDFCMPSSSITMPRAYLHMRHLLMGVEQLMAASESDNRPTAYDDNSFAILLWSTACILWRNIANRSFDMKSSLSFEVGPLALGVGEKLAPQMWTAITAPLGPNPRHQQLFREAQGWLLCSFARCAPSIAVNILALLDAFTVSNPGGSHSVLVYDAIGRVFASRDAATALVASATWNDALEASKNFAGVASKVDPAKVTAEQLQSLLSIVNMLASLSEIDVIVRWLEKKSDGAPDSPNYLECLVNAFASNIRLRLSRAHVNTMGLIEQSVMRLVENCISVSNILRSSVANTLSVLLRDDHLSSLGRLDGSFMQFLGKVVLSDEVGVVKISNIENVDDTIEWFQDRMNHPVYGCRRTDRVFRVSVYTVLRDLIPIKYNYGTSSKPKKSSSNLYEDMPGGFEGGFPNYMKCRRHNTEPVISELEDGVNIEESSSVSQTARLFLSEDSQKHGLLMNIPVREFIYRKYADPAAFECSNGHFSVSLNLSVVASNACTHNPAWASMLPSLELTMLQHFALVGGFQNLARFFPMTDHFGSVQSAYNLLLQKQVEASRQQMEPSTSKVKKEINAFKKLLKSKPKAPNPHNPHVQAMNHVVNVTQKLQQQLQQQLAQQQYQQLISSNANQMQALIAGQPVELSLAEPSAIISYQNAEEQVPGSSAILVSGGSNVGVGGPDSPFQVLELPVSFNGLPYLTGNNSGSPPNAAALNATLNAIAANVSGLLGNPASGSSVSAPKTSVIAEAEVPAYTIYALSMFLKLEYYAISLVTIDRLQGKRVLQAAMGLTPDKVGIPNSSSYRPVMPETKPTVVLPGLNENSAPERKYGFSFQHQLSQIPSKPSTAEPVATQTNLNCATYKDYGTLDMLTVYPFTVLEKIWTVTSPSLIGREASAAIRSDPGTLCALDIILLFVSRISNTKPRVGNAVNSKETRVIDRIFAMTDQIETLRDAVNNPTPPAPSKQSLPTNFASINQPAIALQQAIEGGFQQMPPSSSSGQVANKNPNAPSTSNHHDDYWAKGTGFGSGTTQAQWNLHDHVRRRRLNEEAITCMLNTMSGFLAPSFTTGSTSTMAIPAIGLMLAQEPYQVVANLHHASLPSDQQFDLSFDVLSKLTNSCLIPIVQQYLANDSILDISKNVPVYEACLWLVITIATLRPLNATPEQLVSMGYTANTRADFLVNLLCEEYRGDDVLTQMRRMCRQLKVCISAVNKEKRSVQPTTSTKNVGTSPVYGPPPVIDESNFDQKMDVEESGTPRNDDSLNDDQQDEGLENLYEMLQSAVKCVETRLVSAGVLTELETSMDVDKATAESLLAATDGIPNEELYMSHMKSLQYDSVEFLDPNDPRTLVIPHHYSSQFLNNQAVGNPRRMRRLAQESITLSSSLPLSASSSVFLRACDERLDVFKVLITGPEGTPYANGCFEFDAYFPPDYPNSPLQITLQTTGNNTVRFNPNLYNDGKVCLSVLNTWHGRPEERWNAETSSFLQVLVSIQSLILVNNPYFNEPGYERSRNTPAGQRASRDYDANIRAMNVRWAMLEHLRHPPKAFEDVVRRHFWMKRDEIYNQIESWIADMQGSLNGSNDPADRTVSAAILSLKRSADLIAEEFSKMTPPSGLEGVVSVHYPNKSETTGSSSKKESTTTPMVPNEVIVDDEPTPSSSKC